MLKQQETSPTIIILMIISYFHIFYLYFSLLYSLSFSLFLVIHTSTQTHTAGKRLDRSQLFSRWPVYSAISHHSNMLSLSLSLSFFLSFFLSFSLFSPIRSAKRRKMADKILPQRVSSITAAFICLSVFVYSSLNFQCQVKSDRTVQVIVLDS